LKITPQREGSNTTHYSVVDSRGNVFVSDGYVNARVVHFSRDGQFVRIIGGVKGSQPGQLQLPHGVALDSRGRILVNDSDNQRVSVFDKDGTFVEAWPYPSRGGIAVAADEIFTVLMGAAILAYVVLDGYDLGVGMLHPFAAKEDRERRIVLNSIGPIWDGNEVWLVVAAGAGASNGPVQPKVEPTEVKPAAEAPTTNGGNATPVAARIASAHGLDVTGIPGSGPRGRVTKDDVLTAIEDNGAPPPAEGAAVEPALERRAGL
jgi:pyruvate/2-oxoglutarate dehydrogenase complex dihydrolipoamide acyltransferase (E2) component